MKWLQYRWAYTKWARSEAVTMKKMIYAVVLGACFAVAQGTDYQEATLVNFKTIQTGSNCSSYGNVNGQVENNGQVTGHTTGTSSCNARMTTYYTLSFGDHTYTLRPEMTTKERTAAVASLGYAVFFMKNSVLDKRLPGTKVLLRTDAKGAWVKLGRRESRYEIVEAR
jgi:hypothetical protein